MFFLTLGILLALNWAGFLTEAITSSEIELFVTLCVFGMFIIISSCSTGADIPDLYLLLNLAEEGCTSESFSWVNLRLYLGT